MIQTFESIIMRDFIGHSVPRISAIRNKKSFFNVLWSLTDEAFDIWSFKEVAIDLGWLKLIYIFSDLFGKKLILNAFLCVCVLNSNINNLKPCFMAYFELCTQMLQAI